MRPINEDRLRSTLEYITKFQISEGRAPTYREIKEDCGYSSLSCVSADINRLKERGLLDDDKSSGWNSIKLPNNLQSKGTHNTLIVGAVPCGQPTPAMEDIEAAVALPDAIFGCADHVILHAKGPSIMTICFPAQSRKTSKPKSPSSTENPGRKRNSRSAMMYMPCSMKQSVK